MDIFLALSRKTPGTTCEGAACSGLLQWSDGRDFVHTHYMPLRVIYPDRECMIVVGTGDRLEDRPCGYASIKAVCVHVAEDLKFY